MYAAVSPRRRPLLGAGLKLASVVLFGGMVVCIKLLGREIPVGQTIFVRGVISVLVLALIAWRTDGLHLLKTRNWRSHALRSLSGTMSMFCLFVALTLMPLADVTAITFTSPLFLTILAVLFLGERIRYFRSIALAIGFLGVLIMIGPHLSFEKGASLGVLAALGNAILSAIAMMFLRRMSAGEHAITITFYCSLTFMSCAALTSLQGWPMPTATQWTWITIAGLFGVSGQLLMTYAYRYAEASMIAPLDYSNLIVAVIVGQVYFAETPSISIWIGAPLVVGAGLIILWREYVLGKQTTAASPE